MHSTEPTIDVASLRLLAQVFLHLDGAKQLGPDDLRMHAEIAAVLLSHADVILADDGVFLEGLAGQEVRFPSARTLDRVAKTRSPRALRRADRVRARALRREEPRRR